MLTEPTFDITGTRLADYVSPPKPVSVISTDQAKTTLTGLQKDQTTDMARLEAMKTDTANKQVTIDKATTDAQSFAKSQGGITPTEAKALGADLSGYDYLDNAGMYVPKTGLSANPKENATQVQYNKDLENIKSTFAQQSGYVDAATKALMDSISAIYEPLMAKAAELNKSNEARVGTFGIRSGGDRYAGEVNNGILSSEARAGLTKLTEIATKQARAIAEAQNANAKGKLELFAKMRDEVSKLDDDRRKTLTKLQDEATKTQKEIEKKTIQSSRDSAIAGLVDQGITDPATLLNYLNFDDKGNRTGDFTLKEVSDGLKAIAPDGDLNKLTGETRNFFILKGHGQLPQNISSLPEEQQLSAYLKSFKSTTKNTGGVGNTITLSEAKSSGFPLSVVGMSEAEVTKSFYQPTPPDWFAEKYKNEAGLDPEGPEYSAAWEKYRKQITGGSKSTGGGRDI